MSNNNITIVFNLYLKKYSTVRRLNNVNSKEHSVSHNKIADSYKKLDEMLMYKIDNIT